MPFILFQIDFIFDGFSFLGSGFRVGFGKGDGDGEGVGETDGLGDAAESALAVWPPSPTPFPGHQRAASKAEPKIAAITTRVAAAKRNRF
jgi:hypothetical protein